MEAPWSSSCPHGPPALSSPSPAPPSPPLAPRRTRRPPSSSSWQTAGNTAWKRRIRSSSAPGSMPSTSASPWGRTRTPRPPPAPTSRMRDPDGSFRVGAASTWHRVLPSPPPSPPLPPPSPPPRSCPPAPPSMTSPSASCPMAPPQRAPRGQLPSSSRPPLGMRMMKARMIPFPGMPLGTPGMPPPPHRSILWPSTHGSMGPCPASAPPNWCWRGGRAPTASSWCARARPGAETTSSPSTSRARPSTSACPSMRMLSAGSSTSGSKPSWICSSTSGSIPSLWNPAAPATSPCSATSWPRSAPWVVTAPGAARPPLSPTPSWPPTASDPPHWEPLGSIGTH